MEIVLPLRVVPQPTPNLQEGGDCGACVLGGLLGREVAGIYKMFQGGTCKSFHWREMHDALLHSRAIGLLDRVITDVPCWLADFHPTLAAWGLPSTSQSIAWFDYVTMAFDAGYYGLAMVDIFKKGYSGAGTNHWVMLVGARHRREPFANDSGARIYHELLVSCSSRTTPVEEWVECTDFLAQRGGFNLLLARPTR